MASPAQAQTAVSWAAVGRAGDAELTFTFCEHADGLTFGFLGLLVDCAMLYARTTTEP